MIGYKLLPKIINERCLGKRRINVEMAMKLSKALGGSPHSWLNLQNNWELIGLNFSNFENICSIPA